MRRDKRREEAKRSKERKILSPFGTIVRGPKLNNYRPKSALIKYQPMKKANSPIAARYQEKFEGGFDV